MSVPIARRPLGAGWQRRHRTMAAWLGVFVLILNALAPAALIAGPSASPALIEICSAHGLVTIDPGAPPASPAADLGMWLCHQHCLTGMFGGVLPTAPRVPAPAMISGWRRVRPARETVRSRTPSSLVARGPPQGKRCAP